MNQWIWFILFFYIKAYFHFCSRNIENTKFNYMKAKILYGVISLSLLVLAFMVSGFLVKSKSEPKVDNAKQNKMYVKTQNVILQETESEMNYRGRVAAYDQISLAAEVTGKIMQGDVRFKTGENFKKGDIILNIYKEDMEASLKSGKSTLLQTISKILPDIKVDYADEYKKWDAFFNSIDPEKALPELPKLNSSKEKVFLASNNVLSSYYTLQQQEINLRRYKISAPFNGIFKSVNKEIGAVASPGSELATIIRSDKLEIIVPVFPVDLKWISKGDLVKITDNHGRHHTAKVSRIAGFVEEATQSVNVYLTYEVKNGDHFLEGEYVDLSFKGAEIMGLEIPREALVDNNYVYLLDEQKLIKTPVQKLRQLEDSYIISGIDSSKTIVMESLASIGENITYLSR